MSIGKWAIVALLVGAGLLIGLGVYPGFKEGMDVADTTGLNSLYTTIVHNLPYIALGFIGFWALVMVTKNKGG